MNRKIFLFILFLVSTISVIDLIHPGLPITHDGKDHIARIANFYENFQDGIIIPRWAANLNWGYGHPILEFLYPFPSYLASLFRFSGFSFIDSVKLVFAAGMLFSGIGMFLWLSEIFPLSAAFIGGLLYVFTPYRFVEVYVRGDIGENLAFLFMPFVLYSMHKIYKTQTFFYVIPGAVSLALLILSHNAISLMYVPVIVFYCIYVIWLSKQRASISKALVLLLILGFCLSAFFWIPALLEGRYTLRNIITAGVYKDRFVPFQALLYGPWSYGITGQFTTQLGVINWIMTLLAIPISVNLLLLKNRRGILITGFLIYTLIAILLMIPVSSYVWGKVILLQNFQFPWRFLAIPVLTTPVFGALVFSQFRGRMKVIATVTVAALILILNKDYWHAQGFFSKPDTYFAGVYDSTTDTGESAPIWSVRFMEHRAKSHTEVIEGSGTIQEISRSSVKHVYMITGLTNVRIRENTLYFPGWHVTTDGQKLPVQFQDENNRGIITFYLRPGKHLVTVLFSETKLREFSDILSLVGFFACLMFVFVLYSKKEKKYNKR